MQHSPKRVAALVVVNVSGLLLMALPLVAAALSLIHKRWMLAGLSMAVFFIGCQIQFVIEKRLGHALAFEPRKSRIWIGFNVGRSLAAGKREKTRAR